MRICAACSWGALVALMVATAGCVGAEDSSSAGDALVEASDATAGDVIAQVAPSFDDPAVDGDDEATEDALAFRELVGNNVFVASSAPPAGASPHPSAAVGWADDMPSASPGH